MDAQELQRRTKAFAIWVLRMADGIPQTVAGRKLTGQFVSAGTSVGANYRAACRARSKAEFNSKLQIAQEEADESIYWIEVLLESGMVAGDDWLKLRQEANELTAILTASLITARGLR